MGWLHSLFQRREPFKNPAVESLYRRHGTFDVKTADLVDRLPAMADVFRQGGEYLYEKVLKEQIGNYDVRFSSNIVGRIDESKRLAILRKLTAFMLVSYFNELSEIHPDSPVPSSLTDALHFELYGAMPSNDSFVDYLTYRNPNFEDPKLAPAFKFGNDIAELLETLDLSFSFMVAQQTPVILEISRKLIRLVLFNEPIETAPHPS